MKNNKGNVWIAILIIVVFSTALLSSSLTKLLISIQGEDTDFKKLGLDIANYSIEYCTVYNYGGVNKYKVYKIKNYYADSMNKYAEQIEHSDLWTKEKYYEIIMMELVERQGDETTTIDRDNLYYYHDNFRRGTYAVFDLKNAKLYYFVKGLFWGDIVDYNSIFGIRIIDYDSREVYDVRGGLQNDGTDYYVYKYSKEKGKEIANNIRNSAIWNDEKLNESILNSFNYNEEVKVIENGYYHYKKVCRTSDSYKKEHFTDEEATGYEVGIYDCDNNTFYYYYTTY